jgi:hypothetical protein
MLRTLRFARLAAMAASVGLIPGILAAGLDGERRVPKQGSPLRGVIGHWTDVNDDGPAIRADGTAWNGQPEGAFPVALAEGAAVTNATVRVQFKLVSGQTDQTAGVVFGWRPTGEYYFLRYNTKDGNVAVWQYAGGERKVLTHGKEHVEIKLGTWQELVVTIAGRTVTGALAGKPAVNVEHTFDAPVTGRVGLWTKRDSVTVFKNFTIGK